MVYSLLRRNTQFGTFLPNLAYCALISTIPFLSPMNTEVQYIQSDNQPCANVEKYYSTDIYKDYN